MCAHASDLVVCVCEQMVDGGGYVKREADSPGSFSIITSLQDCGVLRVYGWTAASVPFENGTNAWLRLQITLQILIAAA